MRIAVGSDHAGFALKQRVKQELQSLGHDVVDLGTDDATASVDYPDYVIPVAEQVGRGQADRGVVVCGTGIGASIAANKVPGVRASVVASEEAARLTREHNDSNVLALGGRDTGGSVEESLRWLRVWLGTPFGGGRHVRRLEKIRAYEEARPNLETGAAHPETGRRS